VVPLAFVTLMFMVMVSFGPMRVAAAESQSGLPAAGCTLPSAASEAVVGKRSHVAIYGTDYPTGDGTCVREVLESVQRVAGKLTIREEARREGDPPVLIARAERIRSALGWTPQLDDLDTIVDSAVRWEQKLYRAPW
jgi:UDP-glucose 4-epimerase